MVFNATFNNISVISMLIVNVRDCSADSCNSEEFLSEENFRFFANKD